MKEDKYAKSLAKNQVYAILHVAICRKIIIILITGACYTGYRIRYSRQTFFCHFESKVFSKLYSFLILSLHYASRCKISFSETGIHLISAMIGHL